ncbi:hypothetical protein [Alteromonas sp. 14N.309.X.WAT.G.H12]|uniref:hypothetical protein n=1 Tax=Alteromonas sp. 14N.309.X.WAT.G.H12 TaxID=3120824 RepID=UPI002FD49AAD
MQNVKVEEDLRQLVKDARWAIWAFTILNIFVLFFFLTNGLYDEFVFVLLFIQAFLVLFWLGPVFLYQVFVKKVRLKYAIYRALASYREAFAYFSW